MSDLKKFNTFSIFDKSATIALFLTIFFAICILVIYLITKYTKADALDRVKHSITGFTVGYSVSLILFLGYLKLNEYLDAGYIIANQFYPILAFLLTVGVLTLIGVIISIFQPKAFRIYSIISFSTTGAFALSMLIAFGILNTSVKLSVNDNAIMYIFTILIIMAIAVICIFCDKKLNPKLHTKSIVYASLSIALSFALSYIRFLELPSGGSITLASILPLLIYSYMFGVRRGVLAGVIYGFLQFIQAPWLLHPIQFLLDYPIAFGALGITGMLKNIKTLKKVPVVSFLLGATLGATLRYFSHVVSGVFIFGSGDPNYTAVGWSFFYNSFVFADLAIALVAGGLMFTSKSFVKLLDPTSSLKIVKKETATATNENIEINNSLNKEKIIPKNDVKENETNINEGKTNKKE